jgi:hypothetical protein
MVMGTLWTRALLSPDRVSRGSELGEKEPKRDANSEDCERGL